MDKGDRFRVMDAAGSDGGAGGGGAAGSGAAAAGGGAAAGAAGAAAAGAAAGSAGAAGAGAGAGAQGSALSQAAPAGSEHDWLPEKFRVFGDDKALDVAASARKLAESYVGLEKRVGSGEAPPKDADGYDIKPDGLPEAIKLDELKKDPKFQSFLKSAHGKGMTNAQVQFVLGEFYNRAGELVGGAKALTTDEVVQQLRGVWKDDASYGANMGHAYKAANALAKKVGVEYGDIEAAGLGDNPLFIRLMAALGPEVGADTLPSGEASIAAEDITALSAKLQNPKFDKDPERATWQRKVDAYYNRKAGSTPVY